MEVVRGASVVLSPSRLEEEEEIGSEEEEEEEGGEKVVDVVRTDVSETVLLSADNEPYRDKGYQRPIHKMKPRQQVRKER